MALVDDLLTWAMAAHATSPLYATQLVVGPRFTAVGAASSPDGVVLQGGGIAHNGAAETDPGFSPSAATEDLAPQVLGRPLHELIAFLAAPNQPAHRLRAAAVWQPGRPESHVDVGAAALNAALNDSLSRSAAAGDQDGHRLGYRLGDENGVTLLLERVPGKRFVAVGHIPYGDRVRAAAAESHVLDVEPEGDALPFAAAAETLPRGDVVALGGTALVDGILEESLSYCRPDAYVVLLGPSTPIAPLLLARGVAALSGSIVADPAAVLGQPRTPHEGPTPRLRGMRPVTVHRR
jgi:hypothetical protein